MTFSSRELAHVPDPMRSIRAMRRRYRITQDELAAMLGVHVRTLIRHELGWPISERIRKRYSAFVERWANTSS